MRNIPKPLQEFRSKYGFWPKRELARVYWSIGQKQNDPMQKLVAFHHAMRLWPDIINAR